MPLKLFSWLKKSASRVKNKAPLLFKRLLFPKKWVVATLPPVSFAALIYIFLTNKNNSIPAYALYALSAYALTLWVLAVPKAFKKIRSVLRQNRWVQKILAHPLTGQYRTNLAFRGELSLYRGFTVNVLYIAFRLTVGVLYRSVWSFSIAAYYLVLSGLRVFLILCYRRRNARLEYCCYRKTAFLLFVLNIPMAGMVALTVRNGAGFNYPGYIIYLSAAYTFYTVTLAVINLIKYRRLGSPILSAAKAVNLAAAMMSVLALQTAMLAQFSKNEVAFTQLMNGITGSCVCGLVVALAIYMLWHSKSLKSPEVLNIEQK